MKITKKLAYGVSEDTSKELLYVKRIILRSYKEPDNNIQFMKSISNFKIYQYNYDKAQDSDYFSWLFVDDKGVEHWNHIELSCYDDGIEGIYKMYDLLKICESSDLDIDAEVTYGDIRNTIKKIEEAI